MKKRLLIVFILIFTIFSLFACSSSDSDFDFVAFYKNLSKAKSYTTTFCRIIDEENYYSIVKFQDNKVELITRNNNGPTFTAKLVWNKKIETIDIYQEQDAEWIKETYTALDDEYQSAIESFFTKKKIENIESIISGYEHYDRNGNVFDLNIVKRIDAIFESQDAFEKF